MERRGDEKEKKRRFPTFCGYKFRTSFFWGDRTVSVRIKVHPLELLDYPSLAAVICTGISTATANILLNKFVESLERALKSLTESIANFGRCITADFAHHCRRPRALAQRETRQRRRRRAGSRSGRFAVISVAAHQSSPPLSRDEAKAFVDG